jgi:hypothetical protein
LSRKNDVWICTFAQAVQYHKEKKKAFLSETSAPFKNGNTWKLNLTDKLPDSLYFQPLTIKLKLADNVSNIFGVYQNGRELDFSLTSGYVMSNAIPDGGEVIINIVSEAVDN